MNISGYRIEAQIGKGGMAMVYRAIQESLGRPVALKVMNPLYSDSAEFSERFLDEGRLLAAVHHANIITIHDVGISDGLHFISMEYVDGGDLTDRIREGLTPSQAMAYLESLAACLGVAHDAHIVHRDIKPANVLFRKDGTLLLTDFGIAKQLTNSKGLTVTGSMVGSPHYLSPEQAKGKPVDGRADIYSLGVLYYEMLTGTRPFTGDSEVEIALKHVSEPMPELPESLAEYRGVVDAMTRKDPQERFPSCSSLLEALAELEVHGRWSGEIRSIPLPETPEPGPPTPPPAPRRNGASIDPTASQEAKAADGGTAVSDTFSHTTLVPGDAATERSDGAKRWFLAGGIVTAVVLALAGGVQLMDRVQPEPTATQTAASPPPAPQTTKKAAVDEAAVKLAAEKIAARRAAEEAAAKRAAEEKRIRQETINALVRSAEAALREYRLTTPEEASAYTYYQRILTLDPGNAAARAGIDEIADTYYNLAKRAEGRWDYDRAKRYVDSGLAVRPSHEQLLALRQALAVDEDTTGRKIKKSLRGVKGLFD